jgi:hypothetical protein
MKRALALLLLAAATAGCGSTADSTPNVGADVARAELTAAAANVTTYYTAHGTYAGAATGLPTVTLARADAAGYCVQDATSHLDGPGGTVVPGACS